MKKKGKTKRNTLKALLFKTVRTLPLVNPKGKDYLWILIQVLIKLVKFLIFFRFIFRMERE